MLLMALMSVGIFLIMLTALRGHTKTVAASEVDISVQEPNVHTSAPSAARVVSTPAPSARDWSTEAPSPLFTYEDEDEEYDDLDFIGIGLVWPTEELAQKCRLESI